MSAQPPQIVNGQPPHSAISDAKIDQPRSRPTAIAAILEDWEHVALRRIAEFITKGSTPTTYGFKWENAGVLFLRSECVSPDGLDLTESMLISPAAHAMLRRSEVRDGDLLITITGNVGRVVQLQGVGVANINQHIARIRIASQRAHAGYVYHFLSQATVRKTFESITTGQAYPQISLRQVRDASVPLPQLPEQRAIAEALSDVDGLLVALEALIAKKGAIKQAAMQQLLTGKTRLPGFSGEWETKRIDDLSEIDAETLTESTDPEYAFNYVSLEQVDHGTLVGWSEEKFISSPRRARRVLRAGDVLVATVRPNLHSHLLYNGVPERAVCSTGFAVLRCKANKAVPAFVYTHFFASPINEQIERILAGSNYPAINRSDVARLEIECPNVPEQTAIAAVLSDMDAEIAALEARRDKTRAIKQGMMQQLLTGRVRLVKSASSKVSA